MRNSKVVCYVGYIIGDGYFVNNFVIARNYEEGVLHLDKIEKGKLIAILSHEEEENDTEL